MKTRPKTGLGLSRRAEMLQGHVAPTSCLYKLFHRGEERRPSHSSEANLTLIQNPDETRPAQKRHTGHPTYQSGAKDSSGNLKKEMQRLAGGARLSWEWKGGPPSGRDSPRSQLGGKLVPPRPEVTPKAAGSPGPTFLPKGPGNFRG